MLEAIPTTDLVTDPELLDFFTLRVKRTADEFGLDREGWPSQAVLHWRDGPPGRSIIPGGTSGCLIHLSAGADWHQARYQLAHEVTHCVLCPDHRPFEWVQEMFAIHVSVRALFELGEIEYGEAALDQLLQEARDTGLTTQEMCEADLASGYPPGLYQTAFGVGVELMQSVGWKILKRLGCLFDARGKHDIPAWMEGLDRGEREAVRAILEA